MPSARFSTAFGDCGLSWNDAGLTSFRLPPAEGLAGGDAPLPEWVLHLIVRVQRHLSGDAQEFASVPIDWSQVGDFPRLVYRETTAIKPGTVRSYGDIARSLGLGPEGARAVGAALGANPWPLIIPCHRVVAAGGKMTGFSAPGGVRTKTRLLALEGAQLLSE